jgi:hypothetical protein
VLLLYRWLSLKGRSGACEDVLASRLSTKICSRQEVSFPFRVKSVVTLLTDCSVEKQRLPILVSTTLQAGKKLCVAEI